MKKAFTLIELLVVVAMVAILAAIVVPLVMPLTPDAEEQALLNQLKSTALEAEDNPQLLQAAKVREEKLKAQLTELRKKREEARKEAITAGLEAGSAAMAALADGLGD